MWYRIQWRRRDQNIIRGAIEGNDRGWCFRKEAHFPLGLQAQYRLGPTNASDQIAEVRKSQCLSKADLGSNPDSATF